ncbi:MAG: hypothetical protein RIB45_10670 [Marivibrio sp.]|uniref:hypothetical protein n=1 Tax=Marivibrio sp. TaxID=2039719 RepID=UPI0032EDCADB
MGAKRWALMLVCAVLYAAPLLICPGMVPGRFLALCSPLTEPQAAVLFGLYGSFCVFLFTLSAFRTTPDPATRRRIAGVVAAAFFLLVLVMFWPNAVWETDWEFTGAVAEAHAATFLCVLLLWTALHRKIARSPRVWRRLDPNEIVAMGDRRRAVFWHPALAFLLHVLAARSHLVWITGL